MPDDGIEFTCKFLIEPDECWRYFKMQKCVYSTQAERKKCKLYKEVMKW